MADEKRNIQGYEEMFAVRLGGDTIIVAENKSAEDRYMVCDATWNDLLGTEMFSDGIGSEDFVEIMHIFTERLSERVAALENERALRGIPLQTLTAADCHPVGEQDLNGQIIVVKPEILAPEYRSIDHQMALCNGGNGARFDTLGQSVFGKNLYDGKSIRYRRSDIAGTVSPDRLPEWAKEKFDAMQKEAEKKPAIAEAKPLDKGQFWQIIDTARETVGGSQGMLEPLVASLTQLEETDIIRFKQIFDEYHTLAYKEKLWAAASVMHKGCSDDGFIDFRSWLIAQGKEVYLNALANPDSLADVEAVKAFGREVIELEFMPSNGYSNAASFEAMSYAASQAYERKFGKDADLYTALDASALTKQEKTVIADDITYAPDIDKKWTGYGMNWHKTLAVLEKKCPNLYKVFHEAEPPEFANDTQKQLGEKESVIKKIRQSKQQAEPEKPKNKKHSKGGQEL